MAQCEGFTKTGELCSRLANESGFCWQHELNNVQENTAEVLRKIDLAKRVENLLVGNDSYVVKAIQCPKCGHLFK